MRSIFKKIISKLLEIEARLVLRKYKPRIIGITGSVGKTSTKDAVFAAISSHFHARKSEKSFNSDRGIPLTILGLQNSWSNPLKWIANIISGLSEILFRGDYPEWLILEIGADRPGDIGRVAKWLKPDVVIITRFGNVPVHVEFFPSRRDLIAEKGKLVEFMKDGGNLIVNADDEDSFAMTKLTRNKYTAYSLGGTGAVVGSHEGIYYEKNLNGQDIPAGTTFKVSYGGNCLPVIRRGVLGIQHIYPTLAAIATGLTLGINLVEIGTSLEQDFITPGRMRLLDGIKETYIIDDSYNSSPVALHEAIRVLGEIKIKRARKIAVLGDMLELGKYSVEEHNSAGEKVARVAKILITVGVRARYIAEGALNGGMNEACIFQYEDSRSAGKFLDTIIKRNDIVLIKGSQTIRMEQIVEDLMANPEEKEKLLVRQDADWKDR